MCEPVYYNACPTEVATATFGGYLTGTKLTEAVNDVQRFSKRSEPAKELTDKYRYINVQINNLVNDCS